MLFTVLVVLTFCTFFVEATTVVTNYPPYAYAYMHTEKGGPVDDCKIIYRAEINKITGYMYVDMWARSIVYQAHYTLVTFYMGNSYPEQTIYLPGGSSLTVITNYFFRGAMCGHLNTGEARLKVETIISNEIGWSKTFTVGDYVVKDDAILEFNNEMTYVLTTSVPVEGHYFVQVRIYTRCDSGQSSTGGAWIDFGSGDKYIKLSWIKYEYEFTDPLQFLKISSSYGGTTNPPPGTYAYSYGSSAVVTAHSFPNYIFDYWIFDGTKVYNNPVTVIMNSGHTLCAYFRRARSHCGGGKLPYLFGGAVMR